MNAWGHTYGVNLTGKPRDLAFACYQYKVNAGDCQGHAYMQKLWKWKWVGRMWNWGCRRDHHGNAEVSLFHQDNAPRDKYDAEYIGSSVLNVLFIFDPPNKEWAFSVWYRNGKSSFVLYHACQAIQSFGGAMSRSLDKPIGEKDYVTAWRQK